MPSTSKRNLKHFATQFVIDFVMYTIADSLVDRAKNWFKNRKNKKTDISQ